MFQVRLLAEKVSDQPESHNDKEKMAEFSVPSWQVVHSMRSIQFRCFFFYLQILNALERLGYRVVTSSCIITGFGKHDTRDFVWTLHKAKEEWEASSK